MKTEVKDMHSSKGYGQNKIDKKIMAISPCNFTIIWSEKDQSWGGTSHWSSGLIFVIFGISGDRRMGKHTELKSNPTFNFFAPPNVHRMNVHQNVN